MSQGKPPTRGEIAQQILGALQAPIEPVKVPLSYRVGIFFVALVMVLLPLIYMGLIAVVAYGVYYHMVNHTGILTAVRGRGAVLAFLIYLTPLICGSILVVFMFKPLLSRPSQAARPRSLRREDEPLLFAFVDRICETVGSPKPVRIDVDCEVNASASFRRGFLSMLGNDLVLTIGMPLVAGLNLRQLAGVLAHEFGHFAQSAGMRLTYVVRSINHWFVRVVYERDSWDDHLVAWSQGIDLRIGWVLYLARFFVWLTRKVLWVLMYVGHGVSCYMLRQMEYDADRYEARLAGSDTFESTARQLIVLNVAQQGANNDLESFYHEGRLADNLPRLILHNVGELKPDALAKLRKYVDDQETGWFDTHPADKDRIASAYRENAPGIFRLDAPARVLFSNFDRTAQAVTWDFYKAIFGSNLKQDDIHPVADLIARAGQEKAAFEALARCWQGTFSALRPPALPWWEIYAVENSQETLAQVQQMREQIIAQAPQYNELLKRYDELDSQLIEAEQAFAILEVGGTVPSDAFSQPFSSFSAVTRCREQTRRQQEELLSQMEPFESLVGARLYNALQLLWVPQVAQRTDNAVALQQDVQRLLPILEQLRGKFAELIHIRNVFAGMSVLLNILSGNEDNEKLINTIRTKMRETLSRLEAVRSPLASLAYPFDHAEADMTLGRFAVKEVPASDDWGSIYEAAESAGTKLFRLSARVLGRLCQIAETVEATLKLDPLPEPAEDHAAELEEEAVA